MLHALFHVIVPALLLSDASGGALVGPVPAASPPSASENARLRSVRRAARDGMCTSPLEDAAIEKVGGEFAATYGEITDKGFSTLGTALRLAPDDVFVDCGSGLGRAVVQAAREFGVSRSCGIEYAASRHELAMKGLNAAADAELVAERVRLVCGDCAEPSLWQPPSGELAGATVVYAANLLFDKALNERLRSCLEGCSQLRAVACLTEWPSGLAGFGPPTEVLCETSWSAPLQVFDYKSGGVVPHAGTAVYVYERQE